MRAYFGSRISENITTTPEGFLICLNVPIARTGVQQYLRSELEMTDGDPNDIVDVHREEAEVFSPVTIASFEGKPITHPHPPENIVTPDNIAAYSCGHVQNVRRGIGEESDMLLADFFVTSPPLIEAIKNGLREVSCGYTCNYAPDKQGRICQSSIRGNHVAVVSAGRAGSRVAIKDSSESTHQSKEVEPTMKPKKNNSLFARMFGLAVKDMQPDEIADAIDELQASEAENDETPAATAAAPADTAATAPVTPAGDNDMAATLLAAIQSLTAEVKNLVASRDQTPAPADADPIEALEAEIKKAVASPTDLEESVTIPADEVDDEDTTDEEGPVAPASTIPENPIPGADSNAALMAIKAIKPIIAKLPADQRKVAADAAAQQIRGMMGQSAKPASNGYTAINAVMKQASARRAKDASSTKTAKDEAQVGRDIMAARNPHYKAKA